MRRSSTDPLKLEPVSLREWLPKLGIELPQTTRSRSVQAAELLRQRGADEDLGGARRHRLQLDDTTAKGMLGVADFAAKALRFDLNVDRINADRYLPPPLEKPAQRPPKEPPAEIPVDMLRKLNARGQLRVGEAIFAGIKFTKLRLGVNARDGKVRFNPSEASMYGGQYRGDIGIDATGKVARVTLDEHVSGVDFAPLFKDLFETRSGLRQGQREPQAGRCGPHHRRRHEDAGRHGRFQGRRRCARRRGSVVRDPSCACRVQAAADSRAQRTCAHAVQRADRHRRHEGRRADEQRSRRRDAVPEGDRAGHVDLPKSTLDYRLVAAC